MSESFLVPKVAAILQPMCQGTAAKGVVARLEARSDRVRALAPRRVAVGGLGTAPALPTVQTLAAAGHDHGTGRGRLGIDGAGVFSNGGPIGEVNFGVDVISLSFASPVLSDASKSPGPGQPPPGTGPGQHGPQPGASKASESLCPGRACPGGSGPGRHRQRPGASESQDSVGEHRTRWESDGSGRPPAGVQAAPTATGATPRLCGPGRPVWPAGASP